MGVYIELDKKILEKKKAAFEKYQKENLSGEDNPENLLVLTEPETINVKSEELNLDEDGIHVQFEMDVGFVSLTIPWDSETELKALNLSVKKMNKVKTLLETLK